MIRIDRRYVEQVQEVDSGEQLAQLLQAAVELEHATVPPYLCAYFSLKDGSNQAVAEIIRSVVVEEMLHLTITANLMVALGGSPRIHDPAFVPDYPGGLPLGIGDHLEVHLRKCSLEQIEHCFMAIEEPEHPLDIPVDIPVAFLADVEQPEFATIGAFYLAVAEQVRRLGGSAFTGDPAHQVVATRWFPDPEEMFAITDVASALRGIEVIVDQGEGTPTDPFDGSGAPAHFYRFEEIVKGFRLVRRPGAMPPYAYGGDPVVLDPSAVWDMDDDPKVAKYKPGSLSRFRAQQFNESYTRLLLALHESFNGHPEEIDHAMGLMFELRLLAHRTLSTPAAWADAAVTAHKQTGLSFEYQPLGD